jgi:hypothetical protein
VRFANGRAGERACLVKKGLDPNGSYLTRAIANDVHIATEAHGKNTEYSEKIFVDSVDSVAILR